MATKHVAIPHLAGFNCANPSQAAFNSPLDIPVCHLDIPATCPISDLLNGPEVQWSGGTSQFRALQLVRAAITNGSAAADNPWSHRAPCNSTTPAGIGMPGLTCGDDTVVGVNASDVFACAGPSCTWSGYPWRLVREFANISTLEVLNLANLGVTGGRAGATQACGLGWSSLAHCRLCVRSHAACRRTSHCARLDHPPSKHPPPLCCLFRRTPAGTLPVEWRHAPQLRELQLADNLLGGTIPWRGANAWPGLKVLDLSRNNMGGPVPPELATLESLTLASNKFNGTLPPGLGNSTTLHSLALQNNQLSGPLPPFAPGAAMQAIDLSGNLFTGPLPPLPVGATTVKLDGIAGLSGPLPAQVGGPGAALVPGAPCARCLALGAVALPHCAARLPAVRWPGTLPARNSHSRHPRSCDSRTAETPAPPPMQWGAAVNLTHLWLDGTFEGPLPGAWSNWSLAEEIFLSSSGSSINGEGRCAGRGYSWLHAEQRRAWSAAVGGAAAGLHAA